MRKIFWLLIILLLLGALLRFNHLSDWLYFNMDEERDAFIVKRIIVNHHFTLIGGSIPGGIYLGPLFYYLSVLPLWLAKLNPLGLGVAASALGVVSILLIFKVGSRLFNQKTGIIAAAIFATSYLMVIYNRHFWPLTLAPVASLITIFSIFKIINGKIKYSLILALALIFGLQSDPSNITLLLLTFVCWRYYRLPIKRQPVLVAGAMIIFSHLPLFLFDLRHNFLNSKAIISLFSFGGKTINQYSFQGFKDIIMLFPGTFSRLIYIFSSRDISQQLTPCIRYTVLRNEAIPKALLIISGLILIFWVFKGLKLKQTAKAQAGLKIISFHIIITLLSVILFNLIFSGYIREYFIAVLFPSFILIMAVSLSSLFNKKLYLLVPVIMFLMYVNIKALLTTTNFLGLKAKSEAVSYALLQLDDNPFFIESLSSCFRYNGIRYLFYISGREPSQSFMDSHYSWLYDVQPMQQKLRFGAVFVSLDDNESREFWQQYNLYLAKTTNRKQFGGIEVLIVDNEK